MICPKCGDEVIQECRGRQDGCLNCMKYLNPTCCIPYKYAKAKGYVDKDGHFVAFKRLSTIRMECADILSEVV